jgi:hypothetical protein
VRHVLAVRRRLCLCACNGGHGCGHRLDAVLQRMLGDRAVGLKDSRALVALVGAM